MVPLFAVGEVFLIGAFQLLHRTNVRSEREKREKREKRGRGGSESFILSSGSTAGGSTETQRNRTFARSEFQNSTLICLNVWRVLRRTAQHSGSAHVLPSELILSRLIPSVTEQNQFHES